MRNRIVFRIIGASALLVGFVLGMLLISQRPAFASRSTKRDADPTLVRKYCEVYEQTLAAKLNVTVAQLAAANKSAMQTTVQKAFSDGDITEAQETRLLDAINQLGPDPCADLARAAMSHQMLVHAHQAIVAAVAGALKLSPDALAKDLASGQTLSQIAVAQHVSLADVNAAYLAAVQEQLKAAVANGTITQAQSDRTYLAIQQAVAHGRYPLLGAHA